MKIAVLGTGMVGRALAGRLGGLGHDVVIGTRDVAQTLARTAPDAMGGASTSSGRGRLTGRLAGANRAFAGVRPLRFARRCLRARPDELGSHRGLPTRLGLRRSARG